MDKPIYGCIFKAQMSGNMEINVCINVSERLFRHVFFFFIKEMNRKTILLPFFIIIFIYYFQYIVWQHPLYSFMGVHIHPPTYNVSCSEDVSTYTAHTNTHTDQKKKKTF